MLTQLFDIQNTLFEQYDQQYYYHRTFFDQVQWDNSAIGIIGARGIGKTTFLIKRTLESGGREQRALYLSADNIFFLEHRLVDVIDQCYKTTDVRLVCIDEIHKYPNWHQELKNIVDIYQNIQFIFSGSSSIDLMHAKYDLSRRVTMVNLHGLSFREYLEFYLQCELPIFNFEQIVTSHLSLTKTITVKNILKHFKEYLRVGYYPFFKLFKRDQEKFQAIQNSVQKTVYEDISILYSLKTPTLLTMEKIVQYVINSSPGEFSVYKMANLLGKDFESVSQYLHYLQESGLLRFIYPNKQGKAFLRNPKKIYPDNTNLMYTHYLPRDMDTMIGKVRETFAVSQLQNANYQVFYSERGDFLVDDHYLEIGGKNKNTKQLKGEKNASVFADDLLVGSKSAIPLYLLGFLT